MKKPTDITTKKHKIFGVTYSKSIQTTFRSQNTNKQFYYSGHIRDIYLFGVKIKSIHVNKENL